jgi:hypothetical protein
VTSRLAVLRKGLAIRSSGPRSKGRGHETGCTGGRPLVRSCGVAVIRSSARGSYRLQKSTGGVRPFTPGDEESPDHDDGSSPSARECRRGERASEAGSSAAKPRYRWRVPTKPVGPRERQDQGATCRGKALRIGKVILLDERVVEAVLAPRKRPGYRMAAGRDRERQRSDVSLAHGRKSQAEVASPARLCPDLASRKADEDRVRTDRSWRRAVKRVPSRGRIAARWSGDARKNPALGSGKHPAVSAAQAVRPEIERSTGARVVSRLQRSERGIFSAPSKGAARRTKTARSSTERRRTSTGCARALRAKGCEDFRANVTGNAEGFARSQDRDRTDGRHPGLMDGVTSNRVASSGVLATWGVATPDERRETLRRTRETEISR